MPEENCAITLPLSGGYHALVDAEDYERVSQFKWSVARPSSSNLYAVRTEAGRRVYLHRFILGAEPGQLVDHINADGLDNRRANLRLCTWAGNNQNRRPNRKNSLQLKGFRVRTGPRPYQAQISVGGKQMILGHFSTPEAAARAYDAAAIHHYGEFARTNDALGLLAGGAR